MASIQNGNATPVRLSEQQGLDCSKVSPWRNYSCNGGWMERYFEFYADRGAMLEKDYPYAEQDQTCRQTSTSAIEQTADWSSFVWLPPQASIASIYDELAKGPLSIGINASDWSNYTGGVLTAGERDCDPYRLNHGVTAVAFVMGTMTTETVTVTVPGTTTCRRASRDERRSGTCGKDEFYSRRACCTTTADTTYDEVQTTCVGCKWRIQNQWGVGWGDMGFIDFEVIEGPGVCGFNQYVQGIRVL